MPAIPAMSDELSTYRLLERCAAGDKTFRDADLSDRNLSGFDLSDADLTGANLSGADLRRTNLAGADLSHSDLRGTKLRDANLSQAWLHRARCDRHTDFGPKFDLASAGYQIEPDSEADMRLTLVSGTSQEGNRPEIARIQEPQADSSGQSAPTAVFAGTSNSPHLSPELIAACQTELAGIIGPMANLICQQTLAQYPQLQSAEFVKILAQYIPQSQASEAFLRKFL
ncbi:MAG: pentapeptide repeat-containing protein [Cyanobacteria bacterium J06642_2]